MPTAAGCVRADFVIDLYISMVTYDRSDCLIYLACTQVSPNEWLNLCLMTTM
ncbi:hypothetical protein T4C_909 [Trichinella pseudospiralis]|uniref:Uncharacterized protein n=1 Tax=Trichinella pseudospiralis TaxID=6337 RepID=A0A0V1GQ22_TRIPS|nr:hypothetical protein T4C_909 [Trichinella pseudospiralis]